MVPDAPCRPPRARASAAADRRGSPRPRSPASRRASRCAAARRSSACLSDARLLAREPAAAPHDLRDVRHGFVAAHLADRAERLEHDLMIAAERFALVQDAARAPARPAGRARRRARRRPPAAARRRRRGARCARPGRPRGSSMFASARTAARMTRGSLPRSSGCRNGTLSGTPSSPSSSAALRRRIPLIAGRRAAPSRVTAGAPYRTMIGAGALPPGRQLVDLEQLPQRVDGRGADSRADVAEAVGVLGSSSRRAAPPSRGTPSVSTSASSAIRLPALATAPGVRACSASARVTIERRRVVAGQQQVFAERRDVARELRRALRILLELAADRRAGPPRAGGRCPGRASR